MSGVWSGANNVVSTDINRNLLEETLHFAIYYKNTMYKVNQVWIIPLTCSLLLWEMFVFLTELVWPKGNLFTFEVTKLFESWTMFIYSFFIMYIISGFLCLCVNCVNIYKELKLAASTNHVVDVMLICSTLNWSFKLGIDLTRSGQFIQLYLGN